MAMLTAITGSPNRQGRWVVQVDGDVAATVTIEALERLGLRVGGVVDDALRQALEREDALTRALDRALNMLAVNARSVRDLRRRLVEKGEEAEIAEAVVERLTAMGLLDDAAFARQFARSKALGPGHSRRRLAVELRRKGVAREVADSAIDEAMAEDDVDEEAIVERVARKKLRTLGGVDEETRRRRLHGYLARRGYDLDEIRRVMTLVLAEDASEE